MRAGQYVEWLYDNVFLQQIFVPGEGQAPEINGKKPARFSHLGASYGVGYVAESKPRELASDLHSVTHASVGFIGFLNHCTGDGPAPAKYASDPRRKAVQATAERVSLFGLPSSRHFWEWLSTSPSNEG